jgi:hypothetical protein
MKIIVALVALIALAGIAAAEDFPDWSLSNKLSYSYSEVLKSDELMQLPAGITSSAQFATNLMPGGYSDGYVSNTLKSSYVGAVAACDDPITQTLTQQGAAAITFAADMDKETNVYTMDGYVAKAQELDVTGQINYLTANFADVGYVGENYWTPFGGCCNGPINDCGNAWAAETSEAWGTVAPKTGNTWMDEAWVGTKSTTGISATMTDKLGADACKIMDGPFISGTFDAYAGFDGARVGLGEANGIVTSASGSATHWLGNNGLN